MKFEDLKTGDLYTYSNSTNKPKAIFMKVFSMSSGIEAGVCVQKDSGWNVGESRPDYTEEVEIYRGEVTVTEKALTFVDVEEGREFIDVITGEGYIKIKEIELKTPTINFVQIANSINLTTGLISYLGGGRKIILR